MDIFTDPNFRRDKSKNLHRQPFLFLRIGKIEKLLKPRYEGEDDECEELENLSQLSKEKVKVVSRSVCGRAKEHLNGTNQRI